MISKAQATASAMTEDRSEQSSVSVVVTKLASLFQSMGETLDPVPVGIQYGSHLKPKLMKWIIDGITVTVGGGSVKIERVGLLVSQVQHDNFMA